MFIKIVMKILKSILPSIIFVFIVLSIYLYKIKYTYDISKREFYSKSIARLTFLYLMKNKDHNISEIIIKSIIAYDLEKISKNKTIYSKKDINTYCTKIDNIKYDLYNINQKFKITINKLCK